MAIAIKGNSKSINSKEYGVSELNTFQIGLKAPSAHSKEKGTRNKTVSPGLSSEF